MFRILKLIILIVLISTYWLTQAYAFGIVDYQLDRGTYWNGHVWIPAVTGFGSSMVRLDSFNTSDKIKLRKGPKTPFRNFYLLGDNDKLWLIGSKQVFLFKDKKFYTIANSIIFNRISKPILWNQRPAIFVDNENGLSFMSLTESGWERIRTLPIDKLDRNGKLSKYISIININEMLFIVWENKDLHTYFVKWNPQMQFPSKNEWNRIEVAHEYYMALINIQDMPVLVTQNEKGFKGYTISHMNENKEKLKLHKIFDRSSGLFAGRIQGFYSIDSKTFVTTNHALCGSVRIALIKNDELQTVSYVRSISTKDALIATFILLLLYGISISVLTKKHPIWLFTKGIILFSKRITIKNTYLNLIEFDLAEISAWKNLNVQKKINLNALTISPYPFRRLSLSEFSLSTKQLVIEPTIVYINQIGNDLKINVQMRLSPHWLILLAIITILFIVISNIISFVLYLSFINGIVYLVAFALLIIYLIYLIIKELRHSAPILYDHIISHLKKGTNVR